MYRLILAGMLVVSGIVAMEACAADDSAKAASTRKKLKQKVTLDFKNSPISDVLDEIKDQVKNLVIRVDSKGGVSMNKRVTIQCKDLPLEEALDKMLGKEDLGYVVDTKGAYDGSIFIRMGKERGYPAGEEPKKGK